ncbi:MFS transporter [Phyllobacterium leguminum]|uniref:Putative MFS family arabinose efflux permease n=1 Tax=Phyllobacterium leguminum TaxID=314237 RepID=A0A318T316_9HYPH|nr:MFS transporter [Phyllobacterium leguminum]PYE88415.1 putative MFS family arabinose efflux permease [Phyllobacterium leguminum]
MAGQLLPIAALLFSTFLMLVGGGLAGILLPLRAGLDGWSPTTIGWMGTSYALAFTLGCLIVPRLVRRVGHVRVFSVLLTLLSMSLLLHALVMEPVAWMIFRGIAGFSLAGGYMIVESWLNERVTNETRGRVFSIYMIVSMLGLLAGQFMLPFGNPATQTLFIICALIYASALIPTALSNAQSPRALTRVSLDLKGLYRRSPAAVVGALIAGIVAGAWGFLAPVYGERIGLSTLGIAAMLATAMIGGSIFQYPLGRASDLVDRRYVMVAAGAVGLVLAMAMVLIHPGPGWLIYAIMFLFGSVLYPIYSLNTAHANDAANPSEFVTISSGLLIVYGIGSMIGPQAAGRLMDAFGPSGLFITMAVCYTLYAAHALWRILQRSIPIVVDQKTEFQFQSPEMQQTPETLQLDPRSEAAQD